MPQITARVASITCPTEAEGPGLRWAIWFQGCSIRCPGCCNPHYFTPDGGDLVSVQKLIDDITKAKDEFGIEGITLLGGEPTEQAVPATALAVAARHMGLSVLMFTGRLLEEIRVLGVVRVEAHDKFLPCVDAQLAGDRYAGDSVECALVEFKRALVAQLILNASLHFVHRAMGVDIVVMEDLAKSLEGLISHLFKGSIAVPSGFVR